MQLAVQAGAHVYFGDLAAEKGKEVEKSAQEATKGRGGSAHFLCINVTNYSDLLHLFETAYKAHGHIDYAIANAAVAEPSGFFDPDILNLETVKQVSCLGRM